MDERNKQPDEVWPRGNGGGFCGGIFGIAILVITLSLALIFGSFGPNDGEDETPETEVEPEEDVHSDDWNNDEPEVAPTEGN